MSEVSGSSSKGGGEGGVEDGGGKGGGEVIADSSWGMCYNDNGGGAMGVEAAVDWEA